MSLTQPHAFSPNLIFSESGGNKWKGVCVCVKTRPCFLSGDECKEISLLNWLWLCLSNRKIMIRLDEITTLVSTRLISEARGPVIQSIMLGTWPRDKRMKREYDVCGGPIWSNCLQHKSYSVYQNILPTFLNNFATILKGEGKRNGWISWRNWTKSFFPLRPAVSFHQILVWGSLGALLLDTNWHDLPLTLPHPFAHPILHVLCWETKHDLTRLLSEPWVSTISEYICP